MSLLLNRMVAYSGCSTSEVMNPLREVAQAQNEGENIASAVPAKSGH
jgi:hypothetical protein